MESRCSAATDETATLNASPSRTPSRSYVQAWEGMSFEGLAGKTFMRACDHQVQTTGFVGIMQANHAFRNILDFPFLGDPVVIAAEKVTVPPKETGNPRCK